MTAPFFTLAPDISRARRPAGTTAPQARDQAQRGSVFFFFFFYNDPRCQNRAKKLGSTPLCVHRSGLTGQSYCGRPLSGTAAVALPQPKNLPTPQAALRATDENARLPQGSKLEP